MLPVPSELTRSRYFLAWTPVSKVTTFIAITTTRPRWFVVASTRCTDEQGVLAKKVCTCP